MYGNNNEPAECEKCLYKQEAVSCRDALYRRDEAVIRILIVAGLLVLTVYMLAESLHYTKRDQPTMEDYLVRSREYEGTEETLKRVFDCVTDDREFFVDCAIEAAGYGDVYYYLEETDQTYDVLKSYYESRDFGDYMRPTDLEMPDFLEMVVDYYGIEEIEAYAKAR